LCLRIEEALEGAEDIERMTTTARKEVAMRLCS
jgi:hypothetical protein